MKNYEEGNLEDRHSGHRINPHGSPDCSWNNLMYGVWICRFLSDVKEKGLTDIESCQSSLFAPTLS